jgi:hypothetical protein
MDVEPLRGYLPPGISLELFERWLSEEPCALKIKAPRSTKLGDFRPPRPGALPGITLNSDLRPYQFLTTFVHEIAHLITWNAFGRKAAPHGTAWKSQFGEMLRELATDSSLDERYRTAILRHAERPKSHTGADLNLYSTILELDHHNVALLLKDLSPGEDFRFRQREFSFIELRRTRALVSEKGSGKQFTIPLLAEVERC